MSNTLRSLIVLCLAPYPVGHAAPEVTFRVDFEDGLQAVGADKPLPEGAAGGGYEIDQEAAKKPFGVGLDKSLAPRGQACGRLGGGVSWHGSKWTDLINCGLSFWIMPLSFPSMGSVEIVWGGDAANPYQTFAVKLDSQGLISANHRSYQKNSEMLAGVTAGIPLRSRRWNHVAYVWDDRIGQQLFINGKSAGQSPDKYPASWCFDLRFGGGVPAYWDDIVLEGTTDAPAVTVPTTVWEPTTPSLQRVAKAEAAAKRLIEEAPPGSDAQLRGRIIVATIPQLLASACGEEPTSHAVEDLRWIEKALEETPPTLRPGENVRRQLLFPVDDN